MNDATKVPLIMNEDDSFKEKLQNAYQNTLEGKCPSCGEDSLRPCDTGGDVCRKCGATFSYTNMLTGETAGIKAFLERNGPGKIKH